MAIIDDEPKRLANMAKHGFDFAEFETAFSVGHFLSRAANSFACGQAEPDGPDAVPADREMGRRNGGRGDRISPGIGGDISR